MFFRSLDGTRYPTNLITKIETAREVKVDFGAGEHTRELHTVRLSNGVEVEVHAHEVANIDRQPEAAFAAATGTYILTHGDNGVIKRWPVIGWSVSNDGTVYPVTMNGVNSGTDELLPVLLPSGDVTAYDDAWGNIEEWEREQLNKRYPAPKTL